MRDKLALAKKGVQNPEHIPEYVLGKLFPDSRWGPEWRRENGYVTFEEGGFAGGSPSPPDHSARLYHESTQLRAVLEDAQYDRSLEVGCGYGRLSGWVGDFASTSVAIEPNGGAVQRASALYRDVDFCRGAVGSLPFPPDMFDLIVSWVVLTHVPPDSFEGAIEDLKRVARPDGTILVTERTTGEPGRVSWPRSVDTYEALLDPYELVAREDRGTEPTFEYGEQMDLLVFEGQRS